MRNHDPLILFLLLLLSNSSCEEKDTSVENIVRVRFDEFPNAYNPILSRSSEAAEILLLVNELPERLNDINNDVHPWAAEFISSRDSGQFKIFRFRIRDQAEWDTGNPITTADVELSLKLQLIPGIDNLYSRLQSSHLFDINVYSDSKTFEIVAVGSYESMRPTIATFVIHPKHIYDPEGLLDEFTLQELQNSFEDLADHPKILRYAGYFESEEFNNLIKEGGSGPYRIANWNEGISVTLEKDNDWWGLDLAASNPHLNHFPDRIEYHVIQDESVALIALKNGEIDLMSGVSAADFLSMQKDDTYRDDFHFLSPLIYQFVFFGFNSRLEKLHHGFREAISHLIPYDELVEVAALGFAQRTVGPINPVDTVLYNDDIDLIRYDPAKSEQLLISMGYKKMDGKWYDPAGKVIELELLYQTGSAIFDNIAQILNDRLQNFGLEISLQGLNRASLFQKTKAHDFELMVTSFRGGPLGHNFAPILSTQAAAPGGLNFTGFGTESSDLVINQINSAEKKEEKISGLREFQKMLHEERSMIFLFFEKDRLIVNKRFDDVYGFGRRPGYNVTKFRLSNN